MASGSSQSVLVAGLFAWCLLQTAAALGAVSCPADIDGDGQVTALDLAVVVAAVAGDTGDPTLQSKADVNGDGAVTAADIVLVVGAQGPCSVTPPTATTPAATTPTATRTPSSLTPRSTPTPTSTRSTPTASATPTVTPTPTPTATPTMVCPTEVVVLGPTPTTINDTLASASCQRDVGGEGILVPVNLYSVSGTPGSAIKIDVAAGSFVPYVVVYDADGQFWVEDGSGPPPIEFYVTTSKPYEFLVSSSSATADVSSYTLTVSSRTCPTPVPLTFGTVTGNLDGTECPDPGFPSTGVLPNPADIYSFTVTQVPTNVSIIMQQSSVNDDLYATLSMRSPNLVAGGSWYNGLELVSFDLDTDCSSQTALNPPSCAQINFLALQPGMYAIVASGAGGTGSYSLSLTSPSCRPRTLSNIPADAPLQCNPGHAGSCTCSPQASEGAPPTACGGTLTANTACAAPLQIPGISDDEPGDVASPADLYSFSANAGDVISILMTSDDDAHLYLLGPAPGVTPSPGATPPNVLIAQDDDSGIDDTRDIPAGYGDSELAATLVQSGTYTIVAANNEQVDPDFGPVNYTLYIQKCPSKGLVTPPTPVSDTFSSAECVGYGGIPYRSYSYATGKAGQFLSANVTSDTVDAFVRILGSDGSVVENDTDPFATAGTDARASRILQQNGIYFIEVSTNVDTGEVDPTTIPPPGFTLTATTCPTKPAASVMNGTFGSSSCVLSTGQRYDVYSFRPTTVPSVASVSPPSNGCVLNLMAEGPQTPDDGCNSATSEMPLMSAGGYYGFMIAANDSGVTGPYAARFSQGCALVSATFGDVVSGTLSGGGCTTADGALVKWYLVHGPADVVQFNTQLSGTVATGFAFGGALIDIFGIEPFTGAFVDYPDQADYPGQPAEPLFQFPLSPSTTPPPPFGGDLGVLVRIVGATPSDVGSYTIEIDPASYR
ncbi:MAG: dockerin type I domain-containing protein [Candidatus Binatia bacterium]